MRSRAALLGLVLLLTMLPASALVPGGVAATSASGVPLDRGPNDPAAVHLVIEHVDHELPGDTFVEIDGYWVKKSNRDGVSLGGRVYYYCLAPHSCGCPVCRGDADPAMVKLIYRDESPDFPLSVYALAEYRKSTIARSGARR